MRRCFVSVGLAEEEGRFKTYLNHRRGSMPIKKEEQGDETTTTLGEVAAELEMVQRNGDESDAEEEVDESDESDDDGEKEGEDGEDGEEEEV